MGDAASTRFSRRFSLCINAHRNVSRARSDDRTRETRQSEIGAVPGGRRLRCTLTAEGSKTVGFHKNMEQPRPTLLCSSAVENKDDLEEVT